MDSKVVATICLFRKKKKQILKTKINKKPSNGYKLNGIHYSVDKSINECFLCLNENKF